MTAPAELIPSGPPRYSQWGVPARPFFVVQIPPPAGVMYSRQFPGLHVSAIAIEVVRPPATYAFGTYENEFRNGESGYSALLGPTLTHVPFFPLPFGNARPFEAANASRAPSISASEIVESGKARWANAASAAPPGPVVAHALVSWSCLPQICEMRRRSARQLRLDLGSCRRRPVQDECGEPDDHRRGQDAGRNRPAPECSSLHTALPLSLSQASEDALLAGEASLQPVHELGVDAPTGPCGRVVELLPKMHGHPEQEAIDLPCHLSRAILSQFSG